MKIMIHKSMRKRGLYLGIVPEVGAAERRGREQFDAVQS
jgi:hypothetical protein